MATTTLDPSFGQAGLVYGAVNRSGASSIQNTSEVALGVQADGKIVAANTQIVMAGGTATSPLVVRRYNSNGTLDTSFGTNGQVAIPFQAGIAQITSMPHSLIVRADGTINLVANGRSSSSDSSNPTTTESVAVRLTATGQFDPSFGTNGVVVLPTSVGYDALAVQPDGSLVTAGGGGKLNVVRLTPTGALDTTFNGTGELAFDPDAADTAHSHIAAAAGLVVTAGGQIVVASNVTLYNGSTIGGSTAFVSRITGAGALDTTFGTNGNRNPPLIQISDMAEQVDGKLVITGRPNDPNSNSALLRLLATGQADPSFQLSFPQPYLGTEFASVTNAASTVAIQADGAILVGGETSVNRFLVERFRATGALDSSFGLDGRAMIAIGGAVKTIAASSTAETNTSLAITPAGRIVLGGQVINYGMNSTPAVSQSVLAQILPVTVRITSNDYDGDTISDVAGELTSLGRFAYRKSTGGDVVQGFGPAGPTATLPAPGDYDGDGKTDVAAYLPSLGELAYRPSSGGSDVLIPFGQAGVDASIPAPGDYDGDGKTDPAVYIPSLGELFYRPSTGGPDVGVPFGTPGANQSIPAPGDYNGDGVTDVAVYLPNSGSLAYRITGDDFNDQVQRFGPAGIGATVPAPGDYDGDGITDIAAYLPALGLYAYRPSSIGNDVLRPFGTAGTAGQSVPAPGDYDGDGKTDIAVYLPYSALFAYHSSQGNYDLLQSFGAKGARQTVPAASIPYAQTTAVATGTTGRVAAAEFIPLIDELTSPTATKRKSATSAS